MKKIYEVDFDFNEDVIEQLKDTLYEALTKENEDDYVNIFYNLETQEVFFTVTKKYDAAHINAQESIPEIIHIYTYTPARLYFDDPEELAEIKSRPFNVNEALDAILDFYF